MIICVHLVTHIKSKDGGYSAMRNKKDRRNQRLEAITATTLIAGVDIAKSVHWVRFVDYRGNEVGKAISFNNNREGFESIVSKIKLVCKMNNLHKQFDNILIGMEPTGHYWKPLASFLIQSGIRVVCVNPHHTKKSKEFDDNSPTKSDKKDSLTIARLVVNGHYFDPHIMQGLFGELRVLTNTRFDVMRCLNAVKNKITALLDEYFPEIWTAFKGVLKGKASRQVLRSCPFPNYILQIGETGVLSEIKKAVKKTIGISKVKQLIKAAGLSIGVSYGLESSRLRLDALLDELEVCERNISKIEALMKEKLEATGYSEQILSIKGIGIVTAAMFLGEVGDPLRFDGARQISNYAGFNLVENSSGESKSKTTISKRGRAQFRALLNQMAFTMVWSNEEMKALYKYLTTRAKNPLKKKQALVVIAKKVITIIHSLLKKQALYDPALVFGIVRKELMAAA